MRIGIHNLKRSKSSSPKYIIFNVLKRQNPKSPSFQWFSFSNHVGAATSFSPYSCEKLGTMDLLIIPSHRQVKG